MTKLSPAQQAALDLIRSQGFISEGSGVQLRTVQILRRAGLVDLKIWRARRTTPEWEARLAGEGKW